MTSRFKTSAIILVCPTAAFFSRRAGCHKSMFLLAL
jgi:hypothetical protein